MKAIFHEGYILMMPDDNMMPDDKNSARPILSVQNVTRIYRSRSFLFARDDQGVTAVSDVSLDVNQGEVFGLVGGSGSGKTTLGRLILRLERPDVGDIRFEGESVGGLRGSSLKAFRRKMQMIPQDPYQSLNPYFSIYDTVAEPLVIHGIGDDAARQELVRKALDSCGLSPAHDYYSRYPHQLSGGQRQRAAIARAMVLDPDFVIADEPTSMLDASISFSIFRLLSKIRKKQRVTFLFITHDLAAARFFCDRIAVIRQGRLVETGPTLEIIENPQHEYTKALIAAQPRFSFAVKPESVSP